MSIGHIEHVYHKVLGSDKIMTNEEFRKHNREHPISDESILRPLINMARKQQERQRKEGKQ